MGTFHENLVQSFNNFKNTFLGDPSDIADIGDGKTNGAVKSLWDYAHGALAALKDSAIGTTAGVTSSDTLNQAVAKIGNITGQTKQVTPSSSAQTITPDSGKILTEVDVAAVVNTETYSVTSNGTKDMGADNIFRYVNVNVSSTPTFTLKTGGSFSSAISVTLSGNNKRYIVIVGSYSGEGNYGSVSGCGATLIGRYGVTYNNTAAYYCTLNGTITITPNSQRATYMVIAVN